MRVSEEMASNIFLHRNYVHDNILLKSTEETARVS